MAVMAKTAGQFIKWEADKAYSRDDVTVLSGQNLAAGQVVGRVTVDDSTAAIAAVAGNTGNGTAALHSTKTAAGVKPGVYRAQFIEPAANLGTFIVEDPDGVIIGRGVVGTLFDGVVKFTISDGATDFVSGDAFTITIPAGSNKVRAWTTSAADGSQIACGVMVDPVDATAADTAGVMIAREAVVVARDSLVWAGTPTADQKNAAIAHLLARGIVARTTV